MKALRVMGFKPKNINPKTQETKINGEKVSKLATKADKQEIPRVMKAKSFIKKPIKTNWRKALELATKEDK